MWILTFFQAMSDSQVSYFQVPEGGLEFVTTSTPDFSAIGVSTTPQPIPHLRTYSELDTILEDIAKTLDGDSKMDATYGYYASPLQDDVTFYDDPAPPIKQEKADPSYNCPQTMTDPIQPTDIDLEKAQRELHCACDELGIPASK